MGKASEEGQGTPRAVEPLMMMVMMMMMMMMMIQLKLSIPE